MRAGWSAHGSAVEAPVTTRLAEAASARYREPPKDRRSKEARRLAYDLLDAPVLARRQFLGTLQAAELAVVLTQVDEITGTPYGLWADTPSGFCEDVLGETMWSKQQQILDAIPHRKMIAVPSGFGTGKTWLSARAVAWGVCTRPVGIFLAVTTATRFRQVRNLLWAKELRPLHAKAGLPGQMDQVEWKINDRHGVDQIVAYGFTAVEGDDASFQGIHSAELLLVVDEAGGIAPGIGKNTRNVLTGNARMLAIGNPDTDEGRTWFEDLCEQGEDDEVTEVHTIRIRALDSPAITGEHVPCRSCAAAELRPHTLAEHVVDQAWVDGTIRDYGEDHPYVIAKVHAQFPKGSSALVIPPGWVEAAVAVDDPEVDGEKYLLTDDLDIEGETSGLVVAAGGWIRLGVDVASAGGDELVIARSIGDVGHIRHISAGSTNASAVDVSEKVLAEIEQAERLKEAIGSKHRIRVKVDTVGLGWGVASMLERWGEISRHKADIVRVNVAEKPEVDDEAALMRPWLKRDELWLNMRALLQPDPSTGVGRLRLRVDQKTQAQMSAPLQKPQGGYVRVEQKKDMKKRGISSPDRAEALEMCWYEPYPIRQRKRRGLLAG